MPTSGPKYQEGERLLPDELKPVFQRLVKEYEFLTMATYGRGYISYQVLAQLVLAG